MQDVFWKEQFSEEFNDRSFLSDAAAQAAWWQVASQMDYLARLQHAAAASASAGSSSGRGGGGGSGGGASSSSAAAAAAAAAAASSSTFHGIPGFSGLSAADSMLASDTMAMNAAAHSGNVGGKSAKSSSSSRNSSNPIVRDSLSTQPIPSASTASPYTPVNTSTPSSGKSRLPAGTELKFMTPESTATTSSSTGGSGNRKSSSSSKNRRRANTANNLEPASVSVHSSGAGTTPSSSLSSLSSMAMSYPFFGNPLASLAMPPAMAAAVQSVQSAQSSSSSPANEDKKRSGKKSTAVSRLIIIKSILKFQLKFHIIFDSRIDIQLIQQPFNCCVYRPRSVATALSR